MNYVIDLIVIAIILTVAFFSARYGFVRTAIEIVGFFAVLMIANSASVPIAEVIYAKSVEDSVLSASENIGESVLDKADEIWDSVPKIVKESKIFGVDEDLFKQKINEEISSGTEAAATNVTNNLIKPSFVKIISMLISVILFCLLNTVVKFTAKLVSKIIDHTFVKPINKTLGFVIGIPKGIIIAVAFCIVLLFIATLSNEGLWIFTKENIEKSVTVNLVNSVLPDKGLFSYILK